MAVLGVGEEEEVVSEQVHLERGLLGPHGLRRETLRRDDAGRGVELGVVTVAVDRAVDAGGTTPARCVRPGHALLLDARDLVLDLVEHEIEGGDGLGRGGVRLHEVPLQLHDHVAHLVVGHPSVAKLREVDLDPAGVVRVPGDLADLLAGELAEPRRNVDVLASHDDVHHGIPAFSRRDPAAIGRVYAGFFEYTRGAVPGRGVRAAVTAMTEVTPARRGAPAAAAIVAPVVETWSAGNTRPGRAPGRGSDCGPARRSAAGRT